MTDELRHLLREGAEAHRPDRDRMLARVRRGTTRPEPAVRYERTRALSWPKVVLATLATAGALIVGSFAVVSAVRAPDPARNTVGVASDPSSPASGPTSPAGSPPPSRSATPPAPGPSPSPTRSAAGGGPAAGASPSTGSRPASPAAGNHTEDGPLWADGSVDPHSNVYWSQSNITLKTTSVLTTLTVELRVARSEGVKNTGSWQTRPAADFDSSVREDGRFLVYRWTLKPGRTVPAGQHVFAGQYDHAVGGRDAGADSYRADAATAGGKASVWGDFARSR
ncbi:hypothetical protein ACIGQE_21440 [Streptomyces sp. NPDC053429]|uniref:hypothetical protein n=1 Tax=Streptomyces sp. NPDC053429 TaxID=3365702 RepID=UPI0037CD46F3